MKPIYHAGFFSFENKPVFLFGIFNDRNIIFSAVKMTFLRRQKREKQPPKSVTNTPELVRIVSLFIFENYFLFISTDF